MLSEPQTTHINVCMNLISRLVRPGFQFSFKGVFKEGLELKNDSREDLRDVSNFLLMSFADRGLEKGYKIAMVSDRDASWGDNDAGELTILSFESAAEVSSLWGS